MVLKHIYLDTDWACQVSLPCDNAFTVKAKLSC